MQNTPGLTLRKSDLQFSQMAVQLPAIADPAEQGRSAQEE
jgi:hypothetical protein